MDTCQPELKDARDFYFCGGLEGRIHVRVAISLIRKVGSAATILFEKEIVAPAIESVKALSSWAGAQKNLGRSQKGIGL